MEELEERGLALKAARKVLELLEENCEMYTRELLAALKTWGYGEELIKSLCRNGLIVRYRKCVKKTPRLIIICGDEKQFWGCVAKRQRQKQDEDDDEECDSKKIYNRLSKRGAEMLEMIRELEELFKL